MILNARLNSRSAFCRQIEPGTFKQRWTDHVLFDVSEVSDGKRSEYDGGRGSGCAAVAARPLELAATLKTARHSPVVLLRHAGAAQTMNPSLAAVTFHCLVITTYSLATHYTLR